MAAPRVLIDGYNLSMKHGTGIKTYTGLLDQALTSLGCETSILYGHPIPKGADPLLREVAFHEEQNLRDRTPFARYMRHADIWRRGWANDAPEIAAVPDTDVVVMPEAQRFQTRAVNGSRVYEVAWRRSWSFGKYLDITLPETVDAVHLTFPIPIRVKGPGKPKKIVTIHDLIPLRLPYTTLDDKNELLRRHRVAVAEADLVFTVSEHSKADIIKLLDVPADKIVVSEQPSRFKPLRGPEMRDQAKVLRRLELSPQQYVLFVGAIEPKKNLGRLLRAYVEADTDVPLVVAGPRAWMWEEEIGWLLNATDPAITRKVRFLNHVSVEDLRYLYSAAMALVFPSLYEGYGLPLVEAMAFGLPCLTSKVSSMPEVCGDAALYVDPFDVREMREKLERLVGDKALREYLSDRALQRAQQLTPAHFAEQVAEGYRRIGLLD